MARLLHLLQLGRITYAEGLHVMNAVATARHTSRIGDTLLLMEHPPVLTLGRNANRAHILVSDQLLSEKGVAIHEVNRGGDVTYHGPGQLIGYPIFDLRGDLPGRLGPHLGPVDFVRRMEDALIYACMCFGVHAQRVPKRTGVWTCGGGRVPEKKLAAIGIHVARGITTHGFALNVTTDLRDFSWIVPCGIGDREVTSLELEADTATQPTLARVADAVARSFGHVFQSEMIAVQSLERLLA